MAVTKKWADGVAAIDVALVVVRTAELEIALDTSNSVQVEAKMEESNPVQLIIKSKLIAQKGATSTLTGHQITLTDNVMTLDLIKILQGGSVTGTAEDNTLKYTPPVAGSTDKGQVFSLDCYSAVYDASGQIVKYEKITYPNCQGVPVGFNTEDDTFRAPEYTINSAPKTGQAPYEITYVDELPISDYTSPEVLSTMSAEPGTGISTID